VNGDFPELPKHNSTVVGTDRGRLVCVVDPEDIASDLDTNLEMRPMLDTEFALPPTNVVYDPNSAAAITTYGSDWTRIIAKVSQCGGTIRYRRRSDKRYDAMCLLPPLT
jgi:hypothetical protein